jgi:GT2 family glycosyltransferase
MYKTAVVILNWNGLDYLKKFLGVTVNLSASPGTIIFIADNGSTDGSADWVENSFPSVKLIRLDKNYGFAAGYNIALQHIDAEYFILLNSDIEVTPGWTEPLISFMEDNPDTASCQPKILSWHNRNFFEHAGAAGGYIDKYGFPFCRGRIFSKVERDSGQYDSRKDIFWSSGACMIVRAEAWKKCSGFDPDFFAHMEEIDLCWRFHKAGFRVCFLSESVVYHVGGGVLPYHSPFKTYLNFRNNLFLLYKNLPERTLYTTLFIRRLIDGLAVILFVATGKFEHVRSVWKAHMDYNKSIIALKRKRESVKNITVTESSNAILNKSVVFEFYIKGHKTFDKLITDILFK